MLEYGTSPIIIKGRLRVVPLTDNVGDNKDVIMGYAILNEGGAKLWHELSLDAAKDWMERLLEDENPERSKSRPAARPRRGRRQ
jgi:hypothetical protein